MIQLKNYIQGEWRAPASKCFVDNFEPATGKVYSQLADSDGDDIDLAVAAAKDMQTVWAKKSTLERANVLEAIASGIEERLEDFANAESKDTGKPLSLARSLDIPRAIANFRFFASAIQQFSSEAHSTNSQVINYSLHSPVGIVGAICPWNLPLYLLSWKVAPALAAGNAVIAKPSELSPMTASLLAEVIHQSKLPKGVFNLVQGRGESAGRSLAAHLDVRALSFTGGTKTGAAIAVDVAPQFKKLSLELGGKNPTLIFADANYEEALTGAVRSSFLNQGQICLCGSRLFIQREIYGKFKVDLINRVKALKMGDPLSPSTDQGAIISETQLSKLVSAVDRAKAEGGEIILGGKRSKISGRCEGGWFFEPTLIENLPNHAATNQEEIFGPILSLIPFTDEEEGVQLANATSYGLAASIWSQDVSRCHRVAEAMDCGIVWVNSWLLRDLRTPFGGTKNSGLGREGGFEALRFVTETKNICIKF